MDLGLVTRLRVIYRRERIFREHLIVAVSEVEKASIVRSQYFLIIVMSLRPRLKVKLWHEHRTLK